MQIDRKTVTIKQDSVWSKASAVTAVSKIERLFYEFNAL